MCIYEQARILRFLENSKKAEIDNSDKQQRLRKAITELLGKSKVQKARKIVKQQDSSKPWGLEGQLRVCITCLLLVLLVWASLLA